jgi:hypothetical protein
MELYENAILVIAASSALTSIGVNPSLADLNCVVAELKAKGFTIPVRCKVCKHWHEIKHGYGNCFLTGECQGTTKEEEFCSFGERK